MENRGNFGCNIFLHAVRVIAQGICALSMAATWPRLICFMQRHMNSLLDT